MIETFFEFLNVKPVGKDRQRANLTGSREEVLVGFGGKGKKTARLEWEARGRFVGKQLG